uniref:Uncharacterized protein n=1 Tax=Zea mays TaxID=4577 RepID=A0A804QSQ5_MAIZE
MLQPGVPPSSLVVTATTRLREASLIFLSVLRSFVCSFWLSCLLSINQQTELWLVAYFFLHVSCFTDDRERAVVPTPGLLLSCLLIMYMCPLNSTRAGGKEIFVHSVKCGTLCLSQFDYFFELGGHSMLPNMQRSSGHFELNVLTFYSLSGKNATPSSVTFFVSNEILSGTFTTNFNN